MIDPLTRLRLGGSVDTSLLTRIIEQLNGKVEKLEMQVKLLMGEKEADNEEGKSEVSGNRRKINKDS